MAAARYCRFGLSQRRPITGYSLLRSDPNSHSHTHFRFFVYQIFYGLEHVHTVNVVHHDPKSGNLLVNVD